MRSTPAIFIGSSTEASRVAHALRTNLEQFNIVHVWDGVFRPTHNTLSELLKNVENHDFAIFIFTPDDIVESRKISSASVRDNIIFEFGLFLSVLGPDRTFAIKPKEKEIKIMSDLHGIALLEYIEPTLDHSDNNFQNELRSALRDVSFTIQSAIETKNTGVQSQEIIEISKIVNVALNSLAIKPTISANEGLQHIILTSFEQLAKETSTIKDRFLLPASHYPTLLISLQEKYSPKVRAIALVDQKEKFWRQDQGRKILHSINPQSERIFVFIDRDSFTETWPDIQTHAGAPYKVKLMDYAYLSRISPYHKDFSIIEHNQQKIVAYYDYTSPPNIVFSVNHAEVEAYEKEFTRIQRLALDVKYFDDLRQREEALDELRIRLFSQKLKYDQKPVEMSRYLSIDKYDEYEEVHPFRPEMIKKMLDIFHEKCRELIESKSRHNEPWRILELGAGTGLFTKRLAELPGVLVTAVEYDSVCFNKLEDKMRKYSNVVCMEQDSRSFDPGGQNVRYDFIFSCFADHHIHDIDKHQYLTNIYNNLEDHGLFIVGDELLPRYEDDASRDISLKKYHHFIIEFAQQDSKLTAEQKAGLIDLESKALDSGLKRLGDFKVSHELYNSFLLKAKLSPEFIKIGPPDRRDVGGVYVVTAFSQPSDTHSI